MRSRYDAADNKQCAMQAQRGVQVLVDGGWEGRVVMTGDDVCVALCARGECDDSDWCPILLAIGKSGRAGVH